MQIWVCQNLTKIGFEEMCLSVSGLISAKLLFITHHDLPIQFFYFESKYKHKKSLQDCGIMFRANSIVNTWSIEIIMALLTVDPEALKSCSAMLCEFEIALSLTQEPWHI